jgi:hypothetical protein
MTVEKIMDDANSILHEKMGLLLNVIEKDDDDTYHFMFSAGNPIVLYRAGNLYIAKSTYNGKEKLGESNESFSNAILNLYMEHSKVE